MTTQDIDSVLHEERLFQPPDTFTAGAVLNNAAKLDELHTRAKANHEEFWAALARDEIDWQQTFKKILDSSNAPHYRWFEDGKLNGWTKEYNIHGKFIAERLYKDDKLIKRERK